MNLFLQANISDAVINTIKNWGFWSAIIATIAVIGLGFFLTRKNILKKEWDKVLIKMVMVIGLPSLALQGFLTDITIKQLTSEGLVLLTGFLFYGIMVFGARVFYLKYDKDIQDTLTMCTALASTTFFGIPIVTQLFQNSAITANMFNVPYRIFLYSLGFMIMSQKHAATVVAKKEGKAIQLQGIPSKEKNPEEYQQYIEKKKGQRNANIKNIFLNPILICTFIGLIVWITQLIPGINVVPGAPFGVKQPFSPLRIDLLFPPIAKILSVLAAICTPLAWVAIGMQLAVGDFNKAMKSKTVWYAAIMKVVVAPLIILVLACTIAGISYFASGNKAAMSATALGVLVIMTATPPASVVVSYSIAYDKEPQLASNLTLVSTLLSIITLPIWVIIITAIGATPLFS
ncbi:MAG: AEC family transporter [Spiroplasma sp.]